MTVWSFLLYVKLIGAEIWALWRKRFQEWSSKLVSFLIRSAILFLILEQTRIFGHAGDVLRTASLGCVSVLGASAITLLWDAIRAPASVHQKLFEQHKASVSAIERVLDTAVTQNLIATLYETGRAIYGECLEPDQYYERLDAWSARVESIVESSFSSREEIRLLEARTTIFRPPSPSNCSSEWASRTEAKRVKYWGYVQFLRETLNDGSLNLTIDTEQLKKIVADSHSGSSNLEIAGKPA